MANIPIDEAPNLNLDMENFTDKTPVHFDEMNNRHKQHLNNEKALLYPTFDDSGTASGISSFNDFIATVKNRMRLFDFFKNFKTGMQFVMHLGRAANNCSTTAEGLYLDARQGKVLMDLYTKLNSDFVSKFDDAITLEKQNQLIRFGKDKGNIINISLSIASTVTWTGNPFIIATLPAGFMPRKIEYMVCYTNSGVALIQIWPDGRIVTYTPISNSLCYGSVVYMG